MSLNNQQKKQYKNIGHDLKPIVTIAGNGVSEGVINETERALSDHELIKIKLAVEDRESRHEIIELICKTCRCESVQQIGKVALLFRRSKKEHLKTSNIR